MAAGCSTKMRLTGCPAASVCTVTKRLPAQFSANSRTAAKLSTSLTPPALPRPPAWTCTLHTTGRRPARWPQPPPRPVFAPPCQRKPASRSCGTVLWPGIRAGSLFLPVGLSIDHMNGIAGDPKRRLVNGFRKRRMGEHGQRQIFRAGAELHGNHRLRDQLARPGRRGCGCRGCDRSPRPPRSSPCRPVHPPPTPARWRQTRMRRR